MWSLPQPTLNLSPQDFNVTNISSTTSLCVGWSTHKNIGVFLAATVKVDTPKAPNKKNSEGGEVVDRAEPNSLEPYSNPLTKSLLFPSQPQHSGCESLLLLPSGAACLLPSPSICFHTGAERSLYVCLPSFLPLFLSTLVTDLSYFCCPSHSVLLTTCRILVGVT